jgi:hypothetical protein
MRIKDNEATKKRDRALFAYYMLVIKRHGVYASKIQKIELYTEVADAFFLSPQSVYRVINKMMKITDENTLDTEEDLQIRKIIDEIHCKGKRRELQEA